MGHVRRFFFTTRWKVASTRDSQSAITVPLHGDGFAVSARCAARALPPDTDVIASYPVTQPIQGSREGRGVWPRLDQHCRQSE